MIDYFNDLDSLKAKVEYKLAVLGKELLKQAAFQKPGIDLVRRINDISDALDLVLNTDFEEDQRQFALQKLLCFAQLEDLPVGPFYAVSGNVVFQQATTGSGNPGTPGVSSHVDLTDVSILETDSVPEDGDGIAWHLSGRVAKDLLQNQYPAVAPTGTVNVVPAGQLNYKATVIAFTINGTANCNNTNANLASVSVQVSRNNGSNDSSWTTVPSAITSGFDTADAHAFTALGYVGNSNGTVNNAPFYFRTKVIDTAGGIGYSTVQTVTFLGYAMPASTITTTEAATQEFGQFDYTISATVTRNSPLIGLTGAKLQFYTNFNSTWTDVSGGALTGTAAAYSITNLAFTLPDDHKATATSIQFRVVYTDGDNATFQAGASRTITFRHKFKALWLEKDGLAGQEVTEAELLAAPFSEFAASYVGVDFKSPIEPSGELYLFIAFPSSTLPAAVRDLSSSPVVDYNDYVDCGHVSGNNAEGFATDWYVMRHPVATSGFRDRSLRTV